MWSTPLLMEFHLESDVSYCMKFLQSRVQFFFSQVSQAADLFGLFKANQS